jgi:4-amino-4-deoxy-L-arabinose transferase-like glycosyltransferase
MKANVDQAKLTNIKVLAITIVMLHAAILFFVIPRLSPQVSGAYIPKIFGDGYDQLAENLANGNGYRFYPDTALTLMREPGYPILLAGLTKVFGASFTVVKISNMILAIATAWLLMRIGIRLMPRGAAQNTFLVLGPPVLFLFHPGVLIAESRGGVEMLFAFLITLFLLMTFEAIESNSWQDYLLCGLVLGITVSVRSTPMLFPVPLFAYMMIVERRRRSIIAISRNIMVMILAMIVVLSPWITRNYLLTGKFVPTGSVLGVSAQAGQYIGKHQFEGKPYWILDREAARERDRLALGLGYPFEDGAEGYYQTFYKTNDEINFSSYLLKKVVAEYQNSPMLFLRCMTQNVFNFWFAGKTWNATAMNAMIQLPYLALAGLGAFRLIRTKSARTAGLLVLFVAYVMAVHVPILAQARYSIPLISVIAILASAGLATVLKKSETRIQSPAAA